MESSAQIQKYRLLDPARGLAALAVVFFHRGVLPIYGHPIDWLVGYGEVGANIFFVISGYVIYQSMERRAADGVRGSWVFIKKRFRRIYPPFWASLVISFVLAVVVLGQRFLFRDYFGSFTLTFIILGTQVPQVIYWTLAYEEQFYGVMTLLILPVFNRFSVALVLLSTPIAIAHTLGILSNRLVNSTLPNHWLEFELGILVYFLLHQKIARAIALPIFLSLVVVGFFGTCRTIAPSVFAVVILFAHRFDEVLHSLRVLLPLRWLGVVSYSLYLIHLPAFLIHDVMFAKFYSHHDYLKYAGGIAAAFVATIIFFSLFEKPFLTSSQKEELSNTNVKRGDLILSPTAQVETL